MSKKLIPKCLPGAIIVKSDNTRVASPVILEKPIYIQPQSKQTYVSSDYRSPWLLQQDLKKAEIAYNMYIDEKNKELALQHALGLATVADVVMLGPDVTDLITKGIRYAGKKYLLHKNAKLISSLLDGTPTITPIANNVGWGPRYTGQVVHKSKSSDPLVLYNPKRWDVVNEGANPHGVWYLGEWGVPRTVANATEEKAEKAARARAIFEERPYAHEGELVLEKPIITVGEVPDRSVLSYQADALGADGLIYNDVYDNGYNNNQVILSFKKHNDLPYVKSDNKSTNRIEDNLFDPKRWFEDLGGRQYYQGDNPYTYEDIITLRSHLPEYYGYLFLHKYTDPNYMKGFPLDEAAYLMYKSKNARNYADELVFSGIDETINPTYNGILWGVRGDGLVPANRARTYASSDINVMPVLYDKNAVVHDFGDMKGARWSKLKYKGNELRTNDVVNDLFLLGNDVIHIDNVSDTGPHFIPFNSKYNIFKDSNSYLRFSIFPQNDVIIKPGIIRKSLFGNNGNLDPSDLNLYKSKGGRLIPKHAKGSPVNTNPLPEMPVNINPIPKKEDKKNKLFELDYRTVGYTLPLYLTFPKGDGKGLYMIKRNL